MMKRTKREENIEERVQGLDLEERGCMEYSIEESIRTLPLYSTSDLGEARKRKRDDERDAEWNADVAFALR